WRGGRREPAPGLAPRRRERAAAGRRRASARGRRTMTSDRAGRRGLLAAAALTFALAVGAASSPNPTAASDLWTTLEVRLGLRRAGRAAAPHLRGGTAGR